MDIQGMHLRVQQRRDGGIDQAMPLDLRPATKRRTHQSDAKVAAGARAGVPGVRRAVVADVELQGRKLPLERRTQSCQTLARHARCTAAAPRRASHAICAPMKTKVATVKPKTLKLTQVRSLALKAMTRLRMPSRP